MSDPDMEFCSGKSPGKDSIGVSLNENGIRSFLDERFFNPGHDLTGLRGMAAGAGIEIVGRVGQPENFKKRPIHLVRVVLSGVQDKKLQALFLRRTDDGRHLDDLRAGAEHDRDFHRVIILPTLFSMFPLNPEKSPAGIRNFAGMTKEPEPSAEPVF
jgi:hypothetical protein